MVGENRFLLEKEQWIIGDSDEILSGYAICAVIWSPSRKIGRTLGIPSHFGSRVGSIFSDLKKFSRVLGAYESNKRSDLKGMAFGSGGMRE